MGYYFIEEIAGIRGSDGSITCMKCASPGELSSLSEDGIVTCKEVEDSEKFYFCDSCKERIIE